MKHKIFYWASDISKNNGEGILAENFLILLKKNNPNFRLIKIKKISLNPNSFVDKYILPFYGIFKIWIYHLQNQKTCYINYLPLWNFLIFLLLPKKTLLGAITGTIIKRKFGLILNFFNKLSIKIISIKFDKILLSTNFFKKEFKKKRVFDNFLLYNFKYQKESKTKKFDFIIYYRKHNIKGNNFLLEIVKFLIKNYKIAVIGEKLLDHKNIKNFGYLPRNLAKKIISQSKYGIASAENLYSFFAQDCLSSKLIIFYNKVFKKYCYHFQKQLVPIDFSKVKKSEKIILFNLKKNKFKINNLNFDFKIYFDEYFKFKSNSSF